MTEIEGEDKVYRVIIDNVILRYIEDDFYIQVTVEAELPEAIIARLQEDTVKNWLC